MMAWLNYCDTQRLLPAAICAAAAHELGHWMAIRAMGGRASKLRLTAVGAELQVVGALSYQGELICALAGPLTNLLLAFVSANVGWMVFAGLNLALGLFNLLPLGVLDGGRALFSVLAMLFGLQTGYRVQKAADRFFTCALLLCGCVVFGTGGSITLLVVAVWLVCLLDKPGRKVEKKVVKDAGSG